ncbi:MAG: phosphate signaling complex protein PhoU [Acidobacteria bacterium]|nr:phosphate signaling complex protein PhoU [Acidobacteriota bacterium]
MNQEYPMKKEHTVKSFDEELQLLKSLVVDMAGRCEEQLNLAVEVIDSRDAALAKTLVSGDERINELQNEVDSLVVKILAKRQPMAFDLRMIISVLKIVAELERIADYAAGMGKLVRYLDGVSLDDPVTSLKKMARISLSMLSDLIACYQTLDSEKAVVLWNRDDEIDAAYQTFLNQLQLFMSRSPDLVEASTGTLFMGRNLERIGDHLTNIAENIFFIATGENLLKPAR